MAGVPTKYELADLKALERAFVKLAGEVRPGVVAIQTYYVHPRGEGDEQPEDAGKSIKIPVNRGSGFIIDADGFIATNRHVLEDANDFTVVLDNGRRYDAVVRQTDIRGDLAVLKIDAPDLQPVRWGDLADVRVNQWTFAVGNPFGLANNHGRMSVTYGTVTALGRSLQNRLAVNPNLQYYGDLIETSSSINPGNSGGPLFNIDGEVIGIVTAIETASGFNEGTGFAIPVNNNTRWILDTLKTGKTVRYGFLGVTVDDVSTPRVRRVVDGRLYRGARIRTISAPDGPASTAGLEPGDIVLAVDGAPVENADHLVRLVAFTPAGTDVEVTYLRRTVKRKATVTLGDRYETLGLIEPN